MKRILSIYRIYSLLRVLLVCGKEYVGPEIHHEMKRHTGRALSLQWPSSPGLSRPPPLARRRAPAPSPRGRTPPTAPPRPVSRAEEEYIRSIFGILSFYVHIQFTYPVHIGAAWATAAPARVMVPCACCSEACAVRQSCAVTAAGASRAPKLRRHTAWACTAPGRLPKVRSKSQYPRHIFGCFIREPEGASSQRVSWGTLKRVARPSAHDRVIRHKCTYICKDDVRLAASFGKFFKFPLEVRFFAHPGI